GYPFTLGVASGDPAPDGAVLWTRLAPAPLSGGGMPRRRVPVDYEVALDERFRRPVQRGTTEARPELGHSVHVELEGLEPAREYFFRFRAAGELSPVGRTKTAPAADARPEALAFAFVSCSQYEHGYYTAYRHVAEEDLDVVVHLGDYIYEYAPNIYTTPGGNVRLHSSREITTLDDYRNRHAQYKTDPDMQAAHARFPFIVTWDDHEIDNNWADEVPEDGQPADAFLRRRAAAFQAYFEHMPLRRTSRPRGIDLQLYRRIAYGDLATFNVLDTRQFRSDQACGDGRDVGCEERLDPARSITGDAQERWLLDGLEDSRTRWNVLAQQVFFAQRDYEAGPLQGFSMEAWDGYVASRDRILHGIAERRVDNPVVLTGDVHQHWAADLKADFDDPDSPTLGSEFVCTSITSGGDGSDEIPAPNQVVLAESPHVKYNKNRRGYVRCQVDRTQWRTDFKVLPYVKRPGAPIATDRSFVIEAGRPGLQPVA
ncbi:MAG: alkaline phosphatase D family protein, partial [Solirubrobacterales bacterium]|nr:alkaline phosphatase D family protein [Solirubrobacterales bacterium]